MPTSASNSGRGQKISLPTCLPSNRRSWRHEEAHHRLKHNSRVKKKIKDLSTRGWTWLDEYIQLTRLNALVRGWSEYYKHTSLLEDIEEVTKHVWFRHLQWLMRKHKGARKHKLIMTKTKVIHNRTRWTATIQEGGITLEAYQWLPTRKELKRKRYPQKGKGGFKHPYTWEDEPVEK